MVTERFWRCRSFHPCPVGFKISVGNPARRRRMWTTKRRRDSSSIWRRPRRYPTSASPRAWWNRENSCPSSRSRTTSSESSAIIRSDRLTYRPTDRPTDRFFFFFAIAWTSHPLAALFFLLLPASPFCFCPRFYCPSLLPILCCNIFFSIPFIIFALLLSLPPSRNSDPGFT